MKISYYEELGSEVIGTATKETFRINLVVELDSDVPVELMTLKIGFANSCNPE